MENPPNQHARSIFPEVAPYQFEALRYGFNTYANDLNPVATTILKATLDYPARFGPELTEDIRKWGNRWGKLVKEKLAPVLSQATQ